MKTNKNRGSMVGAAMAAALMSLSLPTLAANARAMNATGKVRLEGDSTLHKYAAEARGITARITLEGDPAQDPLRLMREGGVKALEVRVPVAKLQSGDGALDKNMREALKASKHPEISFSMRSYQADPEAAAGSAVELRAEGVLSVAGSERPVQLRVKATRTAAGILLSGSKALKMSDYGIRPPTMMLGTLKTKDEVVVKFEVTAPVAEPAPRS